jgi:hypothetical protein
MGSRRCHCCFVEEIGNSIVERKYLLCKAKITYIQSANFFFYALNLNKSSQCKCSGFDWTALSNIKPS